MALDAMKLQEKRGLMTYTLHSIAENLVLLQGIRYRIYELIPYVS
jgi:hypothetical protein